MEVPESQKRPFSEVDREPTPQHHYSTRSTAVAPNTKAIPKVPRLKPQPYQPSDLAAEIKKPPMVESLVLPLQQIPASLGISGVKFYATDDHPFNRRGFKYKACRPNPMLKSMVYSTSELPPFGARLSYLDRAPGLLMDQSATIATAEHGWRSARTNVGLREGNWYLEFKVLKSNTVEQLRRSETASRSETPESEVPGHVRIGIARREAPLEAPVGFDAYSYGLRDKTGQKFHLSRPTEFMKDGFGTGDVIGLLVELPSLEVQRRIADAQRAQNITSIPVLEDDMTGPVSDEDIVRDQIPIRYKGQLYYEQFDYTGTKPMEHLLNPVTVFGEKAIPDKDKFKPAILPESKIVVFKNGKLIGTAFQDIYAFLPPSSVQAQRFQGRTARPEDDFSGKDDGSLGYYPMVSCFKTGCCQINTSAELVYVPEELKDRLASGDVKLIAERYDEIVVEEYVWDLVDEVENDYLDQLEAIV